MFAGRAHRRHSRRVPSDTWIFWDPLEPQPHDVDVKALLRIPVVYTTPHACNPSTAAFLLTSPPRDERYAPFANNT